MHLRSTLIPLIVLCATCSFAQWQTQKIGEGGETTIATDGTGHVYVTGHLPCSLFKSEDWGATFKMIKQFPDALGDMFVMARPDGHVNVVYGRAQIDGIGTWYSTDFAQTLTRGTDPMGPLDREWTTYNPSTGRIYMDYSNGYIGGPKSKGVFLVTSDDNGQTFSEPVRVDRELPSSYAVDPYIARLQTGRILCMWQTSTDYNTIDAFRLAYSDDEGKTFSEPETLATFDKTLDGKTVDLQERWILGSIVASGSNKVVMTYPGYETITVDRRPNKVFIQHYRVSTDAGKTFSPGRPVLSKLELTTAIRSFNENGGGDLAYPYYIENLPWLATDPSGHVHIVFTDNRDGVASKVAHPLANWRVRYAECSTVPGEFGPTEPLSEDYAARRPPMDFISCDADSKYVYASWTETPNSDADFPSSLIFTGQLYVGRKPQK